MLKQVAKKIFDEYLVIFPWTDLAEKAECAYMGCGSDR
jgi:hypothetical protein